MAAVTDRNSYSLDSLILLKLDDTWHSQALQKRLYEVERQLSGDSSKRAHAFCDTITKILWENTNDMNHLATVTDIYNHGLKRRVFSSSNILEKSCLDKIKFVVNQLKESGCHNIMVEKKEAAEKKILEGSQTSIDYFELIDTLLTEPVGDIYKDKAIAFFYQAVRKNIWSKNANSLNFRLDSFKLLKKYCLENEINQIKKNIYEHFLINDEKFIDPKQVFSCNGTRAASYSSIILMFEEEFIESDQELPIKIYNQANELGVWTRNSITREHRQIAYDSLKQYNYPKLLPPKLQDSCEQLLEHEHNLLESGQGLFADPKVRANFYFLAIQEILDSCLSINLHPETAVWYKEAAVNIYNRGFEKGVWLVDDATRNFHSITLGLLTDHKCEKLIEIETETSYREFLENDIKVLEGMNKVRAFSDTMNMLLYDCKNLNLDEEFSTFYKKRVLQIYSWASEQNVWDADTSSTSVLTAYNLLNLNGCFSHHTGK